MRLFDKICGTTVKRNSKKSMTIRQILNIIIVKVLNFVKLGFSLSVCDFNSIVK